MSDLLRLLDLGAGSIAASNAGIAAAGNNTANVNTEGYSRQRIDMRSQLAAPLVGGVLAQGPMRMEDALLAGRMRTSAGAQSMSEAFAEALMSLEQVLASSGSDVPAAMTEMFSRIGDAAASPMSKPAREAAIDAARQLAVAVRRQAATLETARREADARVRDQTREASALAAQIAGANKALAQNADPVMMDRRDLAAQKLADLVGGAARVDPDGHMRFVLSGGAVLVDGVRAASLEATSDATLGNFARIEVVDGQSRRNVTGDLDGGRLAGELRFRDETAVGLLADTDQLAYDVATSTNAVHAANAALDGSTGRNFFTAPAAVSGAAAALEVDPSIAANADLLALGTPGEGPGSNGGGLALLGVRDAPVAGGGTTTLSEQGIRVMAGLGRSTATASVERELYTAQRDTLAGFRDSMAGVSVQEELVRLSQFQHASEASARFIGTVDQLLGRLIESI